MVDFLLLNNKKIGYDFLVKGEWESQHLSLFEQHTLQFCHEWLTGAPSFALTTSGSTGAPKPIEIERQLMEISARLTIEKLGLRAGDKSFVCMDTAFIAGKMMLARAFVTGMHLTVVTPTSSPFANTPPLKRYDFTALVPMQLKNTLQGKEEGLTCLNNMKAILVGGGLVSNALAGMAKNLIAPVYHTYGMTETVSHIALKLLNGDNRQNHYTTLPGVKIGQDSRGCLTITAPVTKEKLITTNDLVTIIDEHTFEWEGRIDNVLNTGGIKINIEKLESQIYSFLIKEKIYNRIIVAGIEDEVLGEKLILILEGVPFSEAVQKELLTKLKKALPKYHNPQKIYFVAHFKETSTGKIIRKTIVKDLVD